MVKECIHTMYKYLDEQHFWLLHTKLKSPQEHDAALAKRVDKILINASLYTESKCKFRHHNWWSLPLGKAKFKLYTLKPHLN